MRRVEFWIVLAAVLLLGLGGVYVSWQYNARQAEKLRKADQTQQEIKNIPSIY